MKLDEILTQLYSSDDLEVLDALMDLTGLSKQDITLPAEIVERVRQLLHYRAPEGSDTEMRETAEDIRWYAVSVLGVFFRLREALPELTSLLRSKGDTDHVLSNIVSAISCIGGHPNLQREALRVLSETALDSSYALEVRNTAYVEAMKLDGKLSPRDWSAMQTGALPVPAFDEGWLRSLL